MKAVYSSEHFRRHPETELDGGQLVPPYEKPERAEFVRSNLTDSGLAQWVEPKDFGEDPIVSIHDEQYIAFLKTCWEDWKAAGKEGEAIPAVWPARGMRQVIPKDIDARLGYYSFAAETSISDGTWEAAYAGCQVALTAAEIVAKGEPAFGLCRPPAHHAATDYFGGYCFINNAAVCAQYFLDSGDERIAILDVDFHHGNGTQEIFYNRNDVHYLSLHGDPSLVFPHFLGYEDETGEGMGEGCNRNWVYGPDTPFSEWSVGLAEALKKIQEAGVDKLIISLGVDTFEHDPISFFKLTRDDYLSMGEMIGDADLPTLFLLEGGYAVDDIGKNVTNVLLGFEKGRGK
jgi:acetoin utilization deacetylase AcuC-like enzyme